MSYILSSDSTTDLTNQFAAKHNVKIINLTYSLNGETFAVSPTDETEYKAFYKKMENGAMPITSQLNPQEFIDAFEPILKSGKDILHICFSSGLSGTYNSGVIATTQLKKEYPDRKIILVDSLCASMGEGLLLYYVAKKSQENVTIEECAEYAESLKHDICQYFTVDSLQHLHRGGRVSKLTAIMGTLLQIKPVLRVDPAGKLVNIDKVKGRKKAILALADKLVEKHDKNRNPVVFISHGDCKDEAEYLASLIKERTSITNFEIEFIGPVIGTHSGPKTIAMFFVGNGR